MTPNHVAQLTDALIALFDPVVQAIEDTDSAEALLQDMGYQSPSGINFLGDFSPALGALMDLADEIDELLRGDTEPDHLALFRSLIDAIQELIRLIRDIGTTLQTNFPADFLAATNIVAQFPRQLFDYLLARMIERQYPVLHSSLLVTGILDEGEVTTAATPFNTPYKKRVIRWEKFGDYITSPLSSVQEAYGWNTNSFDFDTLISNVHRFGQSLSFFTSFANPNPDVLRALNGGADVVTDDNAAHLGILKFPLLPMLDAQVGAEIYPVLNATRDKVAGLGLGFYFDPSAGLDFPITDELSLRIRYSGTSPLDAGVLILPGQPLQLVSNIFGGSGPQVDLSTFIPEFAFANADEKSLLLDSAFAKLEFASWAVRAGVFAGLGGFYIETEIKGATLTISEGQGDGFLQKVLPAQPMTLNFELTVGFSSKSGLYFGGSSALEVRLPAHVELGPVSVEALTIGVKVEAGKIPVSAGADLKLELGPLVAVVENMGVTATLSFPPGNSGNLGPLQFDLGFKPPRGVGLSLDAGGFKGGGFLRFDSEKGEYAGALELDFNGLFSVKAIGIINTKMPDGSKGFSLLIVIAAEFTPIQLSFGFTLNGVGGIFGLNRRIVVAALAEGIRTNAVKSILFPENVIANISRIISDIKQFFPPQQDHFVVGPMAKLGWGTPSIITVELGLLLDLPDPMFAIVGVLKAVLPAEEAPILRLQVNFLGVVDFGRGYIFFRADLFDSRLLVYSITGSMAFLVSWGEAQTFALSVGGFHPDFRDLPTIPALPDGFGRMARIGISLLSDDNPRLKVESYFAVTSNTVQFGARIELYAEAGSFNIYGFLGYDVLFQFDPFRFIAKLSGGVALRRHSSVIAGVSISATLSGPTPWDARGKATLSLLFFSISVGFHATWGDPPPAIAAATEDLLKLLQREFADTRNWRADLPSNNHLHVSLRKIELPAATETLVIHPAGVLTFSQRSLPLEDFVIQKFGNKKPVAENKFKITNANSDNAAIPADFQSVREQFAPGNFLELSDSEKLSRKSFDNLPSGFKLTATSDLLTTLPVVRPVDYELSYLRRERIVPRGLIKLFVLAYDRLVKGSAVRQSGLAQQQTRVSLNAPPQVGLTQETFAVANAADLKSHVTNASGPVLFATQAEAYQHQQELIAQNPALAGQIQVVSHFELNPN
jgi:hypothetical protein